MAGKCGGMHGLKSLKSNHVAPHMHTAVCPLRGSDSKTDLEPSIAHPEIELVDQDAFCCMRRARHDQRPVPEDFSDVTLGSHYCNTACSCCKCNFQSKHTQGHDSGNPVRSLDVRRERLWYMREMRCLKSDSSWTIGNPHKIQNRSVLLLLCHQMVALAVRKG